MAHLGPRVKKDIPLKIYDKNDTLVSDLIDKVLDGWQDKGLYHKPEPEKEYTDNINIYNDILHQKRFRQAEMCLPDYVQIPELNGSLFFDELEYMINKLMKNKSVGIDQIPNEALKKHEVMLILFQLYVKCFDSGLLPTL